MTDLNALIAPKLQGAEPPPAGTPKRLDELLGPQLSGPGEGPSVLDTDRENREIATGMDLLKREAYTPQLNPSDLSNDRGVFPFSVGEAIVEAGKRGITMEASDTLWEDIDWVARNKTIETVRSLGKSLDNVPHETFRRLAAAWRWVLVRQHSTIADEEKDDVLVQAGLSLFSRVQGNIEARMHELEANIPHLDQTKARFAQRELDKLREGWGKYEGQKSLLVQKHRPTIETFREYVSRAVTAEEDKRRSRLMLEGTGIPLYQFSGRDWDPWSGIPEGHVYDDLVDYLGEDPERTTRIALSGASTRARLARFGLTQDEYTEGGDLAIIRKNYPGLLESVLVPTPPGQSAAEQEAKLAEGTLGDALDRVLATVASGPEAEMQATSAAEPASPLATGAPAATALFAEGRKLVAPAMELMGGVFLLAQDLVETADEMITSADAALSEQRERHIHGLRSGTERTKALQSALQSDYTGHRLSAIQEWLGPHGSSIGLAGAALLDTLGGKFANAVEIYHQTTGDAPTGSKKDRLGLGEIARRVLGGVPPEELDPELGAKLLSEAAQKLAVETTSLEDVMKYNQLLWGEAAKEYANGNYIASAWKQIIAAVHGVKAEGHELLATALGDPTTVPAFAGFGMLANRAGRPFLAKTREWWQELKRQYGERHRLRRALQDVMAFDPEGARRAAKTLQEIIPDRKPHAEDLTRAVSLMEHLASDAYRKVDDVARLTNSEFDRFWDKRRVTVKEIDRHLGKLHASDLQLLLRGTGMAIDALKAVTHPVRVRLLADTISMAKNRFMLPNVRLTSTAAARHYNNIAGNLLNSLASGESLATLEAAQIPLMALGQGYRRFSERFWERLRKVPILQKIIPEGTRWQDHSTLGKSAEMYAEALPYLAAARDYNTVVRGRQLALLDRLITQYPDKLEIQRLLRTEVEARGWDQTVRFSRLSDLEHVTLDDIYSQLRAIEGEENLHHGLWMSYYRNKIRDRKTGDTWSLDDVDDLIKRAFSEKGTVRLRARLRKQLLRSFFDRDLVAYTRHSPERGGDVDEDLFQEDLPYRPLTSLPDQKKRLAELKSMSATINASKTNVLERTSGWSFGTFADLLAHVKTVSVEQRNDVAMRRLVMENFQRELNTLSPKTRKAFDDLLSLVAERKYPDWKAALAELKLDPKTDAGLKRLISRYEAGAPDTFKRAWEDFEDARHEIFALARDVGLVDESGYQTFVRPYAPHLFAVNELPDLVRPQIGRKVETKLFKAETPAGIVIGPGAPEVFARQHHVSRYRAVVVRRDGRAFDDKLFDDQTSAVDYLLREHFVKKEFKKGKGVLESTNEFGDRVFILDPLGEQAQIFQLMSPSQGLVARVSDLLYATARHRISRVIDRPGWTVDEKRFLDSKKSAYGRKKFQDFIDFKIPKSAVFGNLAGKFVHRRALRLLQQATAGFEFVESLSRTAHEILASDTTSRTLRALSWVWDKLGGFAAIQRDVVAQNKIARNPRTHINNRLMDRHINAVNAAGRGYVSSPEGAAARNVAYEFLLGFDRPDLPKVNADADIAKRLTEWKKTRPEDAALVEEALAQGFGGESLVLHAGRGSLRRMVTEDMFGELPDFRADLADPERKVRAKETLPKLLERAKRARIELAKRDLSPDAQRALLKFIYTAEEVVEENTRMLARQSNTLRWFIGLGAKRGSFNQVSSFSGELYARSANAERIGPYIYLRQQGYSPEFAADRVRRFMQDYSTQPGVVQRFRKTPFANPIFSYPAEQFRILKNTLKENPGVLLGWALAAPVLSTISLLSAGVDPIAYYSMQGRGDAFSALDFATSTLVVLNPLTGQPSTVSLPGITPFHILRNPYGVFGNIDDSLQETSIWSSLANRIGGLFFGESVYAKLAESILLGRNPRTSERISGGYLRRMQVASGNVLEMFIPATLPYFSGAGEHVADSLRKPPYFGTGNISSATERMLQSFVGVKSRGGFVGAIDSLAAAGVGFRPLNYGTKLYLEGAGLLGRVDEVPDVLPEARGFTPEEFLTATLIGQRKFITNPYHPGDPVENPARVDALTAAYFIGYGERTGDSGAKALGERLRAKAAERLAEDIRDRRAFSEQIGKLSEEQLETEGRGLMRRALRHLDLRTAWDGERLLPRVRTLVIASDARIGDRLIKELTARMLWGADGNSEPDWSNPVEIQLAKATIEEHLRDLRPGATGVEALAALHGELDRRWFAAEDEEYKKLTRDRTNLEAYLLWKDITDERGTDR